VLPADPVADDGLPRLDEGEHVSRDGAVRDDRAQRHRRVAQDLLPVRVERGPVAGRQPGHRRRRGVPLPLEEERQIRVLDLAQLDRRHGATLACAPRPR